MGSAASAEEKKEKQREEKLHKKTEKKLLHKQKQREKILKDHQDFDEAGNPFFYDDFGEKFFLDDDLIPYYLDERKARYYFDRNGHKFYLDEKGRPYHVDDHGQRCHWDEKGNPFYISEDGDTYYLDYDRLKYYFDEDGMPYFIDDTNNKIWIRFDSLDKSGRVISRTLSRKAIKQAKAKGVTEETIEEESDRSDMIKSPSAVSISSRASNIGRRQTSFKSKEMTWFASTEESAVNATAEQPDYTTVHQTQQPTFSIVNSASTTLLSAKSSGIQRFRTLTPDIDKYADDGKSTMKPEDLAEAQLEADRKILIKILQDEKDKGQLPPRKTFRKIGHYRVKEKNDMKDCSITGSAFLPNGNLVISDFHNRNLKMYDPDLKFVLDLKLDAYPENMCARAEDFDLYVPFKAGMQYGIKVVKVTDDSMTLVKTLKTKGQCYGICSNNGGLAVIVNTVYGWQVHLLDLNGNTKRELTVEEDDKPLLKRPDYLSVTRDLRLLISDRGANAVFCFDIWSQQLYFDYKAIREPYGVSCDNKGSIFVTCPGGVHQISTTGERIAQLMTREEIGFSPTCACYDVDDSLLVLTGQSNSMAAFQMMDSQRRQPDTHTNKKRKP